MKRSLLVLLPLLAACAGTPHESGQGLSAHAGTLTDVDTARGGRIYDNWFKETRASFRPDVASTSGVADGRSGPHDDGTLSLGTGAVLLNDAGHDYRLKNFFGWDLRGASGLYGTEYMDKRFVLRDDLLAQTGSIDELVAYFERGSDVLPAFGAVLDATALRDLAGYVIAVREGVLPRPSDVFTLTSRADGYYALHEGGDAERGLNLYMYRCMGCHGTDGTRKLFDGGVYSLGSHARQKAYEDWAKILNGQPGTNMGRSVEGNRAQMTQDILDLFAALCDRERFPLGTATGTDVPDGDPRCGVYLR